MKEINKIIELKTNSKTERLTFKTRYLVQINFTFDLSVTSNGFNGTSHFCVRLDQLKTLSTELNSMYTSLSGTATLDDNDSDAFVQFIIEPEGQLIIAGQLGGSHEIHFMKFRFQTDQTSLPGFIDEIDSLEKYKDES